MMLLFLIITTLYSHSCSEGTGIYSDLFSFNSLYAPELQSSTNLSRGLHKSIEAMCLAIGAAPLQDTNPAFEGSETPLNPSALSLSANTGQAHTQEQGPATQVEKLTSVLNADHSPHEDDDPAVLKGTFSLLSEESGNPLLPPNSPVFNFSHSSSKEEAPQPTALTNLFLKTKIEQILQNPTQMQAEVCSIYQTAEINDPAPSSIAEMLNSIQKTVLPITANAEPLFCIHSIGELCTFILSSPSLDLQLLNEVKKLYTLKAFPHLKTRNPLYQELFFIRTTTKLTYALQILRKHLTPANQPLKQILQTLKIDNTSAYTAVGQCADFLTKHTSHPNLHLPYITNPATALCQGSRRKMEYLIATLKETETASSKETETASSFGTSCLAASGAGKLVSPAELIKKAKQILQNPTKVKRIIYGISQDVGCRALAPSSISEMLSYIHQEIPGDRKYDDTRFCIRHLGELCTFLLANPPLDQQLLEEVQYKYNNTSAPHSKKYSRTHQQMFLIRTATKLTYALQTLRKKLTPDNHPLIKMLKTLSINDSCAFKALEQCSKLLPPSASQQLDSQYATNPATDLCRSSQVRFARIINTLQKVEQTKTPPIEQIESHSSAEGMGSNFGVCRLNDSHAPEKQDPENLAKSTQFIDSMCLSVSTPLIQDTNTADATNIRKRKAKPTEESVQSKVSKNLSAAHVHSKDTPPEDAAITPDPRTLSLSSNSGQDHTSLNTQEQGPAHQMGNLTSVLSADHSFNEHDGPVELDISDIISHSEFLSLLLEGWEGLLPNSPTFTCSNNTPAALVALEQPLACLDALPPLPTSECHLREESP